MTAPIFTPTFFLYSVPMGVDPGGDGGIYPPPPNISGGGGWPVQSSPPPIIQHQKKKKERKINDESPVRVVYGYYSQDDHQYTHFAISYFYITYI